MGPTETRSRDEWLAEVKRRGGRLRRRRRLVMAVGATLALALPLGALTTFIGNPDGDVRQLVAGPAPSTAPAAAVAPDSPVDGPGQPAVPEEPPTTTTTQAQLRVEAVHERTQPPTGGSAAPADDPVVRATTTTIARQAITSSPIASPPPPTTIPPAPCVAEEFRLVLSLEKNAYKPGETIRGSWTLEKRSSGTCLMPDWWIAISLQNSARVDVSQKASSSGSNLLADQHDKWVEPCGAGSCPHPVEPGAVFSETFYWETTDCTEPPVGPVIPVGPGTSNCVPFPPGTYSVVADWHGPASGPPSTATVKLGG